MCVAGRRKNILNGFGFSCECREFVLLVYILFFCSGFFFPCTLMKDCVDFGLMYNVHCTCTVHTLALVSYFANRKWHKTNEHRAKLMERVRKNGKHLER